MQKKPLPIVLLSITLLLAPIANILFACWLQHMPIRQYMGLMVENRDYVAMLQTFVLWPSAAVAVFAVKRWSFPAFVVVQLMAIGLNVSTWLQFPEQFSTSLLLLAQILNLAIVGYVLLPHVRAPYFNPKLRWWESLPRFYVSFPCVLFLPNSKVAAEVINISKGGVYIKTRGARIAATEADVELALNGNRVKLHCRVAHVSSLGCGLQFLFSQSTDKAVVENFIRDIKDSGLKAG